MSFAVNPLKTVRVIDPRVHFSSEREYSVLSGGNQVSWKPFLSTSFSNSSFNFSAPPPNPGICVDPRVYVSVPITIQFAGVQANVGLNLLQQGHDAFRAFPISSVCSTLTVRINNSAASINLSDVLPYILRYNTSHKIKEFDYSVCPTMQDYYQIYADGRGTVRNSLGTFGDNSWETARGAFPMSNVTNTPTNATISATVTEPLFLSPFLFGKGAELHNGFIGVQTMDFQFTFSSDLTRLWSHDVAGGATFNVPINGTGMIVNFSQPSLLFNYISPKLLEPIPRSISYSYMVIDRYPTDNNIPVNFGQQLVYSSNNIQLGTIPRRMYIFARRRNSTLSVYDTDTFAAIENVTINYNNYSGLLSSATQVDLYNISKKNGCNLSFPEWTGGAVGVGVVPAQGQSGLPATIDNAGVTGATYTGLVGGILCLDWGIDIGLDDLHAPGEILNSQLQITANFRSINRNDLNQLYTFYIVTVSEGIWTVENLNSIPQIGVLSKEDILNSKQSPVYDYKATDNVYGGDFVGKLKSFGKKALAGIRTIMPYAKDAASIVSTIAPFLPLIGLGEDEYHDDDEGGVMMGGKRKKEKRGGKTISRKELHRRLM